MNKVNSIVICRNEYREHEDFENAIKRAIMVVLENNYIATVRYDEKGLGIVAIDYDHAQQEYGCPYPYWLTLSEIESVTYEDETNDL